MISTYVTEYETELRRAATDATVKAAGARAAWKYFVENFYEQLLLERGICAADYIRIQNDATGSTALYSDWSIKARFDFTYMHSTKCVCVRLVGVKLKKDYSEPKNRYRETIISFSPGDELLMVSPVTEKELRALRAK